MGCKNRKMQVVCRKVVPPATPQVWACHDADTAPRQLRLSSGRYAIRQLPSALRDFLDARLQFAHAVIIAPPQRNESSAHPPPRACIGITDPLEPTPSLQIRQYLGAGVATGQTRKTGAPRGQVARRAGFFCATGSSDTSRSLTATATRRRPKRPNPSTTMTGKTTPTTVRCANLRTA